MLLLIRLERTANKFQLCEAVATSARAPNRPAEPVFQVDNVGISQLFPAE